MAAETECIHSGCCVSSFPFYYELRRDFRFLTDIQIYRLEKAAADPETLTQTAIIENLNPQEAARLSKVRNIGIAVRSPI